MERELLIYRTEKLNTCLGRCLRAFAQRGMNFDKHLSIAMEKKQP